jgi:DNA invertase Pin-like site-specific DNA recombinase
MNAPAPTRPVAARDAPPADAATLAYCRVSTEEQGKPGLASLPDQEKRCRALAAQKQLAVDYVWVDTRPRGDPSRTEAITRWCEAHPGAPTHRKRILALRRDRIFGTTEAKFYETRLKRAWWVVECVERPRTGNALTDNIADGLEDALSERELEIKSDRAHTGMHGQAQRGASLGRAPFGYERVAVAATGTRRRLAPYEHAAKGERVTLARGSAAHVRTVQRIFALFAEGASLSAVTRALVAAQAPGPFDVYPNNRGGVTWWTPHTVKAILVNAAYVGRAVWNRRKNLGKKPDGHDLRALRPRDEWTVVENAHPALVDGATWDAAQRRFTHRAGPRVGDSPYLLTGLVRCQTCGNLVTGGGGTRPKARDPDAVRFYRDRGAVRYRDDGTVVCGDPILTASKRWLEGEVIRCVRLVAQRARRRGDLARLATSVLATRSDAERASWADLERERRTWEAKRGRLLDAVADGTIPNETAKAKLAEIEAGLAQLAQTQERGRVDLATWRAECAQLVRLTRATLLPGNFEAKLHALPPAVVRDLLRYWVADVTIDKRRRRVYVAVRRLPTPSLSQGTQARRVRARRCWRAASRPCSPG